LDHAENLLAVRNLMANQQLDAFIVPRADEYLGEYVPPQNERLHWISGFSGSAGTAIVLKQRAAIFVDGRYTIQVRQQCSPTLFDYHHLIDEPPLDWLLAQEGIQRIGVDTRLHTFKWYNDTLAQCRNSEVELVELADNPIDQCWQDRPVGAFDLVTLLQETYTGESSISKRERIGSMISSSGAGVALLTQLDTIAWLLNIRGSDVPRLPVLLGSALLSADGSFTLFTDPRKIPNDFADHVGSGVTIADESSLAQELSRLANTTVLADPNTANAYLQLRCVEAGATLVAKEDPVLLPKAQKNSTELDGMRNCHIRDGAAVTGFIAWLERQVSNGRLLDEAQLSDRLYEFRAASGDLHDLSFDTISAAGPNSAICHYNHMNGEPATLVQDSLYLVDSGGQYLDGTTDITRTVAIGTPSEEHRQMFTLVLKGHIALSQAIFPKGTAGVQLDVLARQFLWQIGRDYDHGTGHGVGTFLSVHEGPQRISKAGQMSALMPGMVVSNEPGYYQEGDYGIRCENLMAVRETDNGMLGFETITFAPFDRSLVDASLMSESELSWLNQYHDNVNNKLSPLLADTDQEWLLQATAEIPRSRVAA
jgi:Xaa-Pro aminopeptidase